jgi:hypothetical protein
MVSSFEPDCRDEPTSIVAISPPAFRARTGRQSFNADSVLGGADDETVASRSNIMWSSTPNARNGSCHADVAQTVSGSQMMRKAGPIILLLLTSCATGDEHHVRPLRPLELATAPYQEFITNQLAGSLAYEGSCLLFREDRTNSWLMPIWPMGSVFNGTSVIFHEPGKADQQLLVAQQLAIEGRALSWRDLDANYYGPFAHQCAAQPFLVTKVRPAD